MCNKSYNKMKKIKFENWQKGKEFKLEQSYKDGPLRIGGVVWYKTTSEMGRSKGIAVCPCCNYEVDIFIWSFSGGGKICTNCNVLLTFGAAYIEQKQLTEQITITGDKITVK